MSHQKILILDFGSQVSQLIARRVREQQVYCELHPFDVSEAFIRDFQPNGIILSGGPNSVYESLDWKAPQAVFELGVPVLGICYGMQTMRSNWAARWKVPASASSVLPKFAPAATPNSSTIFRIVPMPKGMVCWKSG